MIEKEYKTSTKNHAISIMIISVALGVMIAFTIVRNQRLGKFQCFSDNTARGSSLNDNTSTMQSRRMSRWKKNKLVVIPAIWKEIDWFNVSSWPIWLTNGLSRLQANGASLPYYVHLYQRISPNCTPPYDWPYSKNLNEEAGIYLSFIHEYYHDLPDKMLFIHGNPHAHSPHPIERGLCVRADVHYVNINDGWIQSRRWTAWKRDLEDKLALTYRCARQILNLFGFNGELQLNPSNIGNGDENTVSVVCCAQFYVTKERIQHYTYEQWSAVYRASLEPYCINDPITKIVSSSSRKWFGGSLELLWHVILGLNPTNMVPPRAGMNTDLCHFFRSGCLGSPCHSS